MASQELINTLKKDTVVERDYIIVSGTTNKVYLWFKLYDDCYQDGNFIQTFIMKRIELEYFDVDIDFKGKEFKAYKEFKTADGSWEKIDYGTFIVTDVDDSDTKESIKVTAYDYALKFANQYKTDLKYSTGKITLKNVLEECCNKVGVELATIEFANSDFIVDSNQFEENQQYGNVVKAVAGMAGSFAKIVNDKLYLIFNNEINLEINASDYEEFEDKRDSHPITVVVLGNSQIEGENVTKRWEEGIALYGENLLIINDNPFAYTQDKRQQLIEAIYNQVKGFSYSSVTLKNCLFPHLKCGDLVKIKNKSGNIIKSIILRRTFDGVEIKLESPSIIKATVQYQFTEDTLTIAKRAEAKVDKAEGKITLLSQETAENEQKIAQQEITSDAIKESVSSLDKNLEELKSQTEQTTGKLELTISRSNGNNLVKNSDMAKDTDFWQAHLKSAYTESDTPPESPVEDEYWYCTANYGSYIANQMYKYTSGTWVESNLTRKLLDNALNLLQYTSSYETDESKLNTASGRFIRIDVDKDYPNATHSYNSTNLIPIDTNEEYITLSVKVKNNIKLGNVMLLLGFLPNFELPTVENPSSLYEPSILLTPDDYSNELHQYTMTVKIPKKSEYISVATGTTPPTDTTKYWLHELQTGIGVVMQFDGTNWVQYKTDKVVYEEDTKLVWTYRALYGAYYKTNYTSDLDFKSVTCVIAFYGGFALTSSTTAPTPQKGLYWLDTANNKCFRAKYNKDEFVEWEDTGLTATWVSQNIMPVVNTPFVPPKGYFEFSDLKVEWNSIATRWNRYQGEIYSKNFKADENGLSISSGKNVIFIDEDEITASYNNINIFGINEDLCFTRRFRAEQEIALGEFKWFLANIGGDTQMLLN